MESYPIQAEKALEQGNMRRKTMEMTTAPTAPHIMKPADILAYGQNLREEERSSATIEKYSRDVRTFYEGLPEGKAVNKAAVLSYKEKLERRYAAASVNTALAAVNRFFSFMGWEECRVKFLRVQHCSFREPEKELTKAEYGQLLSAAKDRKNERLYLLIQTICATGLRVSEHQFVTVEAVRSGRLNVHNKGKERVVLLPAELTKPLLQYCRHRGIRSGPVFVTRSGRPMDRSNIWAEMKKLCKQARVDPAKVYPHNLRHLFALTYYRLEKDIVRLADILGHSSVETTRIYTSTNLQSQKRLLSRLGLVHCRQ